MPVRLKNILVLIWTPIRITIILLQTIIFAPNHINILHQNINGLLGKSDCLSVELHNLENKNEAIDVICITEHNMMKSDTSLLKIPNYTLVTHYSRGNRHGGSCILVRKNHRYKVMNEIESLSISNIIECTGMELTDYNILIICIYRPPKVTQESYETFFETLNNLLSMYCFKKRKIVLCGDFNIDMLKADKYSFEFKQLLQGFNLKLAINDPTRLCSGTCIDNFGHNMKDCKTRILELALSDHTAQLLMCPVSEKFGNPYWFIMKRDYSKENIEKFKHCLMAIHFKDVYNTNNPNTAFNSFFDEFKLFYDMCFPLMRIRMRSYQRPKWITKGIIKCSRQKRKLLWKYRKDPNLLNKKCFKTYSSRLKNIMKLTKKAQNNYFIKTSKNKTKATWTIINEYKNKTKNYITQINNDHKKITDPNRIAELFNNFFIEQVKPHDNFKARNMTSNNMIVP
ncbi:uncharacterized protein LOC128200806 [Galleria mellonella]|uniref:Uncharacterized protein LOC128200806 n=1 Tax=Galleria mellonella TaxID=7137 RepID=A0ABM3MJ34_GALME|nr:uncharacterized protein LOC128200806 [Galleria mellonella]